MSSQDILSHLLRQGVLDEGDHGDDEATLRQKMLPHLVQGDPLVQLAIAAVGRTICAVARKRPQPTLEATLAECVGAVAAISTTCSPEAEIALAVVCTVGTEFPTPFVGDALVRHHLLLLRAITTCLAEEGGGSRQLAQQGLCLRIIGRLVEGSRDEMEDAASSWVPAVTAYALRMSTLPTAAAPPYAQEANANLALDTLESALPFDAAKDAEVVDHMWQRVVVPLLVQRPMTVALVRLWGVCAGVTAHALMVEQRQALAAAVVDQHARMDELLSVGRDGFVSALPGVRVAMLRAWRHLVEALAPTLRGCVEEDGASGPRATLEVLMGPITETLDDVHAAAADEGVRALRSEAWACMESIDNALGEARNAIWAAQFRLCKQRFAGSSTPPVPNTDGTDRDDGGASATDPIPTQTEVDPTQVHDEVGTPQEKIDYSPGAVPAAAAGAGLNNDEDALAAAVAEVVEEEEGEATQVMEAQVPDDLPRCERNETAPGVDESGGGSASQRARKRAREGNGADTCSDGHHGGLEDGGPLQLPEEHDGGSAVVAMATAAADTLAEQLALLRGITNQTLKHLEPDDLHALHERVNALVVVAADLSDASIAAQTQVENARSALRARAECRSSNEVEPAERYVCR